MSVQCYSLNESGEYIKIYPSDSNILVKRTHKNIMLLDSNKNSHDTLELQPGDSMFLKDSSNNEESYSYDIT